MKKQNYTRLEVIELVDKIINHQNKAINTVLNMTTHFDSEQLIDAVDKPAFPLDRIRIEGVGRCCKICKSSVIRSGFLGLFGELLCVNDQCKNSKSKKIYSKL